MADQLDLQSLLRGQVSVKPEEHDQDRAARIRREDRAALIDDCKGIVVFACLLLAIGGIAALSVFKGFFDPSATPDTQRWAQQVLTAVVSGSISFVVGRKVGK